ncbi:MAG: PDZ domain-containing protein, partial [Psychrosphaera sp.]|nr:PDZ domain-containing protein [Psychrosphaera sp.]
MIKVATQVQTPSYFLSLMYTLLVVFGLCSYNLQANQNTQQTTKKPHQSKSGDSSITPRTLNQILRQIDSYYVDEVNVNVLLENAIKEVFKQLDPHSTYLNERDLNTLFEMANGQYDGLGIEVELRNDLLVILETIKNSPAEMAGLQKGDIIDSINGVDVKGKTLEQVSKLIKQSKQKTQLVVKRDYYDKALEFSLEKAKIEVESVTHKLLHNDIGYVKIYTFQSNTTDDIVK